MCVMRMQIPQNWIRILLGWGLPAGSVSKELLAMQETQVWFLGGKDHLEKEVETLSSIPD